MHSYGLDLQALCGQLQTGLPETLRAIYLTGSRARGEPIFGSDVDLSLIFAGGLSQREATAIADHARSICREIVIPVDVEVLDEIRARDGITPKTKQNRLLWGQDVLAGCPLMSADRISLLFARLAMRFVRLVRGRPERLIYPLSYPSPAAEFLGYEIHGARIAEGCYIPGLNSLLNLTSSIGMFRLAVSAAFFSPDKGTTARVYQTMLPGDPWGPLVEKTYLLCHVRCGGRLPVMAADREELVWCTHHMPEFENCFIREMLRKVPRFLESSDSESRWTASAALRGLEGDFALDMSKIEEVRDPWR